jgi:hypothetical protein
MGVCVASLLGLVCGEGSGPVAAYFRVSEVCRVSSVTCSFGEHQSLHIHS